MSNADLLRRAAANLREHAEAATSGPWNAYARAYPHIVCQGGEGQDDMVSFNLAGRPVEDSQYAALVHPPVALALADLLEHIGDDVSDADDRVEPGGLVRNEYGSIRFDWTAAVKLARAILREPEDRP